MSRLWLIVMVVWLAALSFTPVRANTATVNPSDEPTQILASEAEFGQLAALLNTTYTIIESEISPDDTTLLVSARNNFSTILSFLNVETGAQTPVVEEVLALPPLSEVRWQDSETAIYFSLAGEAFDIPVLVSVNRTSGAVLATPIALTDFPISLSPDGTRMLVEVLPPSQAAAGLRSRFDKKVLTRLPNLARERQRSTWSRHRLPTENYHMFASEEITLAVLDLRSGQQHYLQTLSPNSQIYDYDWTGDSNRLALNFSYLFEFRVDYNFVLTQKTTQDSLGNLPLDQNPFVQNSTINMFDVAAAPQLLSTVSAAGGDGDYFFDIDWSSNYKDLMVQMWHPSRIAGRKHPIATFPDKSYLRFYSSDGQLLSSFEHPEVAAPYTTSAKFIGPDEVLFRSISGMSSSLFYYNRVSGEFRKLPMAQGSVYQSVATHQSRRIIYWFESATQPPELYRVNWDGSAIYGLTFANAELAANTALRADAVSFTLANGQRRSGILVQPQSAAFPPKNVPIVVWQQGGPGGDMVSNWGNYVESPYSLLPNFGIAVLIVPLTGREGYGPAFLNSLADNQNFGRIDIDEQAEIARQMIIRGWTTQKQLGIVGCSYGGYFTTQSIVRHSKLYAAANTQCSWVELIHDWQFVDVLSSYLTGKTPTSGAAEFAAISPLYNSTKILTPLLIFHGTEDFQPIEFMQTMHDQLEANKVPVKMVTFLNEGHGLRAGSSQLMAAQEQLIWFRTYLGR